MSGIFRVLLELSLILNIEHCLKYKKHAMKQYFSLIYLLLLTTFISAQVGKSSELQKTIKEKDSLLFNVGFNNCDVTQFQKLVSDDFEFYHDQSGITTSKSEFIQGIENGLCKLSYKPKRVLDEKTLEVFPLKKNGKIYGAIENGIHKFFAIEKNKPEYITSIAKFTHLWILKKGNWKLSRGLSYDHNDVEKPFGKKLLFKDKNITDKWLKQKGIPAALGIGYIEDGKIKQISVFGELEKGKELVTVLRKNLEYNIFYSSKAKEKISETEFLEKFTGAIVAVEKESSTEKQGVSFFNLILTSLIIVFSFLVLLVFKSNFSIKTTLL